jgi:tetratricopeptide (TPR) repeat protein
VKHLAAAALLLLAACSNAGADPEGAYARGRGALAKGDPRTARIELLNAIKARPNDAKLRIAQAETYLALGDGAGAQAEVEQAHRLGAMVSDTAHLMAHALFLQGQHRAAVAQADLAGSRYAGNAGWVKGLALAATGDPAAAAAAFDQAQAAGPDDPKVWTALARFRRGIGDLQGAIDSVDRALALKALDVEALTLRGELTRGQYGLAAALPWFDRALQIDPGNVLALLERAATYGDLGRMSDMLADTRKALSLAGPNPRAYYLQAMLAARGGNFRLAQSLYVRMRGALEDQPATILLASAIDYQTGNVQRAVKRLVRLVEMQPDNRKARKLLAASYWKLGDAIAAANVLRPIADLPDADTYTLTLMGRALERRGDASAASHYLARAAAPQIRNAALSAENISGERLSELRQIAASQPNNPEAQIRLIGGLLAGGLGEEALGRARALQGANPGVPDVHLLVGDALGTRGDFRGAAEQYRKAANLSFTEPVAMRLIEALERSGQAAAAAQVLDLFLRQNPRNVAARLLAANAHMRAGNWAAAIDSYEGLRQRLGDRDSAMLNNLAWAYGEQGDYERAIPLARRAWALDRSSPATADTLGWLLVKSGRGRGEGLLLLEQAARGAPGDAAIQQHLLRARRG